MPLEILPYTTRFSFIQVTSATTRLLSLNRERVGVTFTNRGTYDIWISKNTEMVGFGTSEIQLQVGDSVTLLACEGDEVQVPLYGVVAGGVGQANIDIIESVKS